MPCSAHLFGITPPTLSVVPEPRSLEDQTTIKPHEITILKIIPFLFSKTCHICIKAVLLLQNKKEATNRLTLIKEPSPAANATR